MNPQVSDRDREKLSALLDGRLSEKERIELVRRIGATPALEEEWKQLQRLKAALSSLPRHKVRRSFTLSPDSVPARKTSPLLFPMRLVSGLASAVLVILLAFDATVMMRSASIGAAAPAAASEAVMAERAADQYTGEIIQWVTPTAEFFGKGGGPPPASDANSAMMAAPAETPSPVEPPVAESQVSNAPPLGLSSEATPVTPAEGSPILGIPAPEDQGKVLGNESREAAVPTASNRLFRPAAEIFLLLLALGTAITAVALGRRK
jgi:hypothetical protein